MHPTSSVLSAVLVLAAVPLLAQQGVTPFPAPVPVVAEQPPTGSAAAHVAPVAGQTPAGTRAVPFPFADWQPPIPAERPAFDLRQHGLPGRIAGTERWLVTFFQ